MKGVKKAQGNQTGVLGPVWKNSKNPFGSVTCQ